MKRFLSTLLSLSLVLNIFGGLLPAHISAANEKVCYTSGGIDFNAIVESVEYPTTVNYSEKFSIKIQFNTTKYDFNRDVSVHIDLAKNNLDIIGSDRISSRSINFREINNRRNNNGIAEIVFDLTLNDQLKDNGRPQGNDYNLYLNRDVWNPHLDTTFPACTFGTVRFTDETSSTIRCEIQMPKTIALDSNFSINSNVFPRPETNGIKFKLKLFKNGSFWKEKSITSNIQTDNLIRINGGMYKFENEEDSQALPLDVGKYQAVIESQTRNGYNDCATFDFDILNGVETSSVTSSTIPTCNITQAAIDQNTNVTFTAESLVAEKPYSVRVVSTPSDQGLESEPVTTNHQSLGNSQGKLIQSIGEFPAGQVRVELFDNTINLCFVSFSVTVEPGGGKVIGKSTPKNASTVPNIGCQGDNCTKASGVLCNNNAGVQTAIGCVPTDPSVLTNTLLRYLTGIAGGLALILMIYGGLQMVTANGDDQKIKAGRDQFNSAVIGLLFILFSVILLRIIGVDILGLNNLGVEYFQ